MAEILLDELWIHDADNLATFVRVTLDRETEQPTVDGETRMYASGRMRAIVRPGRPGAHQLRCLQVERADVDQLRAWVGKLLLFREPRGRKFYGWYRALPITELPVDLADVDLTVDELTHSEAV